MLITCQRFSCSFFCPSKYLFCKNIISLIDLQLFPTRWHTGSMKKMKTIFKKTYRNVGRGKHLKDLVRESSKEQEKLKKRAERK